MGSNTDDERTRLTRTGVQAAVTAVVGYVILWGVNRSGVDVDPETLFEGAKIWVVPIIVGLLMPLVTGVIAKAGQIPYIGRWILLLNGPRKEITYLPPTEPVR